MINNRTETCRTSFLGTTELILKELSSYRECASCELSGFFFNKIFSASDNDIKIMLLYLLKQTCQVLSGIL